jgi:hypothetical protein
LMTIFVSLGMGKCYFEEETTTTEVVFLFCGTRGTTLLPFCMLIGFSQKSQQ